MFSSLFLFFFWINKILNALDQILLLLKLVINLIYILVNLVSLLSQGFFNDVDQPSEIFLFLCIFSVVSIINQNFGSEHVAVADTKSTSIFLKSVALAVKIRHPFVLFVELFLGISCLGITDKLDEEIHKNDEDEENL